MSSLYEGVVPEKLAVVIDIGYRYTKFGFVGEFTPRCIIPSEVKSSVDGKVRKVWCYQNEQELYSILVDFIHLLYFQRGLVSPKDRNVIIVESLLTPTIFRDVLARVCFQHYEVSSIMFVPSHLVALCALGVRTALVVDVGHKEVQVVPVVEGVPVLSAWQSQPLGSEAVESRLKARLYETASKSGAGDASCKIIETLPESVIEDIKVRCCFVTTPERGKQIFDENPPKPPPSMEYIVRGQQIIQIPGTLRESAYEVLFERDNDEASLPNLMLDAILKCSIDARKPLAENILFTGGTVMAPGFKSRVMKELKALLESELYVNRLAIRTFKVHKAPAKDNYTCWLGGSLFGATDMLSMKALVKENYLNLKTVPDWSNLSTNSLFLMVK